MFIRLISFFFSEMRLIISIFVLSILVTGLAVPLSAVADVIKPNKQIDFGISVINVQCKEGLVKIVKINTDSPACVKPASAEKLQKYGWAQQIDEQTMSQIKKRAMEVKELGTVKKLVVSKQLVNTGKLDSSAPTAGYNYVFEACAGPTTIRAPTIVIQSDSEVKTIKLPKQIPADTCLTSVAKIKAANVDSISGKILNKGSISNKITQLEDKVEDLKMQLSAEKAKFAGMDKTSADIEVKVGDIAKKIVALRSDLNKAQQELNQYLFSLNVSPNSKITAYKSLVSITGQPIQGATTNIISITKQVSATQKPFGYNVVFEACTASDMIRAPKATLTSDIETKPVKLAEKISPNSCQVSLGVIKADNKDTIKVALTNVMENNETIVGLEKKIADLDKQATQIRNQLNDLSKQVPAPEDLQAKVSELTNKLIENRSMILEEKSKLHYMLARSFEN